MESTPERRSIPIHLLNFMSEQVQIHAEKTNALFLAHTKDEMERYDEILALIAQSNNDSNQRHSSLLKSVDDHMATTQAVHEALMQAFPVNKHGKPDYIGHAAAHEHWIEEASSTRELKEYIRKVALAAAVTIAGSWLISLIWAGVLKGQG